MEAEHIDPLAELSDSQGHQRLAYGRGPAPQREIRGVDQLEEGVGKARVAADNRLDFRHIRFFLCHRYHQLEKVSLHIVYFIRLCCQSFGDMVSLQIIHTQTESIIISLLAVNSCSNTLLSKAFRHPDNVFQGMALTIPQFSVYTETDKVRIFQYAEILWRKLEIVDSKLITLSMVFLYNWHCQRMDNQIIFNLDDHLVFLKNFGQIPKQQGWGKCDKNTLVPKYFVAIVHQEFRNCIRGRILRFAVKISAASLK